MTFTLKALFANICPIGVSQEAGGRSVNRMSLVRDLDIIWLEHVAAEFTSHNIGGRTPVLRFLQLGTQPRHPDTNNMWRCPFEATDLDKIAYTRANLIRNWT